MPRHHLGAALLLLSAVETGCFRQESKRKVDAGGDGGPLAVTFSVSSQVPADQDQHLCRYVAIPNGATFLTGFSYALSNGFHHLFAFQTDLQSMPAGGDALVDCYVGSPGPMDHARATVFGGETATGSFSLPAGVGLPVTPGQVLVLQSHFLNATAGPLDVEGSLTFDYSATDPGQHAGAFFFFDLFIDVGIAQTGQATMRCHVPSDITVLTTVGAAYSRAIGFEAFVDGAGQPPTPDPFYQAEGWGDPLPIAGSPCKRRLVLALLVRLRQLQRDASTQHRSGLE